ncbi:uncharacterized protein LOC135462193 [Liolophura sinensis]|uniref:uncharacterized protein LOC135462193 n=1 Tax=Liolophura sinensis TaxID=3198878 RepID=UPI0031595326
MRVLLTLCLLACLGYVLGHGPYCCAPDQWEGTIQMLEGYATPGHPPGAETGTTETHFDFTNQREATFSNLNAGLVNTQFRVLKDYKKQTQFTYHPDSGACEKKDLPYPLVRTCPPYSAVKLDPVVFGGGSDKAIVDMYMLANPTFNETFGFTRDKCLPFTRALWGSVAGDPLMQIYSYINLTIGIKDTSVFDVPSSCKS